MKWLAIFLLFCGGMAAAQGTKSIEILAQADTLLSREDYAGALKLYNKVLKSTKPADYSDIRYRRAFCNYNLGKFNEALSDLNGHIHDNVDAFRAIYLRAVVNHELENDSAELVDLDTLIKEYPDYLDLNKWRAGTLINIGKFVEARNDLILIAAKETDEEVELYLGLTYYYDDKPDEAITHFDLSLKINGQYVPAYMYAGSLCIDQGAYDLALSYIDLGLRLEPQNMQLVFYKGVALVEKNSLDKGCQYLAKSFYNGVDDAKDYLTEYCYGGDD